MTDCLTSLWTCRNLSSSWEHKDSNNKSSMLQEFPSKLIMFFLRAKFVPVVSRAHRQPGQSTNTTQLQLSSRLVALVISCWRPFALILLQTHVVHGHGHRHGLAPDTKQGQRLFRQQSVENIENRLDSVWFSVPLFVCSLGNSEKKTEMHLFIAGQHAMQACQSGQAGRQTDLHWVPWTFWIIDHNKQSIYSVYTYYTIHMYLSMSDLTRKN